MVLDKTQAKELSIRIKDSLWAHGRIDPNAYTRSQAPRSMDLVPETLRLLIEAHQALIDYDEWDETMSELKWINASEIKPSSKRRVLAAVRPRHSGLVYPITAKYVWRRTEEANPDSDYFDYDEEYDLYWTPEGWYETVDNWGVFSTIAVTEGDVIAWAEIYIPVLKILGDPTK